MKKTISVLFLIFSLLLALTACGGDKAPATETPGNSDSPVVSDEPSSETPSDTVDPNAAITEEMVRSHPEAPASDFDYVVTDEGVAIRSYLGSDTIVVVPAEIEGKPVVGFNYINDKPIPDSKRSVFDEDAEIRGVLIPNDIEGLSTVFKDNDTIEIAICEGVSSIVDGGEFTSCTSLRQVFFGDALKELTIGAFLSCRSLEEIHVTAALEKIAPLGAPLEGAGLRHLVIYGPAGSYAETASKEYNIPFKAE